MDKIVNVIFIRLLNVFRIVQCIDNRIGTGVDPAGCWWIKFVIDIKHPSAWSIVQELAYIVNYLSIEERLPTVFKPVSPPPYLNGNPEEHLSWVIECYDSEFTPDMLAALLEGQFSGG